MTGRRFASHMPVVGPCYQSSCFRERRGRESRRKITGAESPRAYGDFKNGVGRGRVGLEGVV